MMWVYSGIALFILWVVFTSVHGFQYMKVEIAILLELSKVDEIRQRELVAKLKKSGIRIGSVDLGTIMGRLEEEDIVTHQDKPEKEVYGHMTESRWYRLTEGGNKRLNDKNSMAFWRGFKNTLPIPF